MKKWRTSSRSRPKALACERRRNDDARRREERRAHSYVSSYLKRGRIVPPTRCDACGGFSADLRYFHPNPAERRVILWLCPSDRRAVPASGQRVIPHWEWPGHVTPLPTRPRWPRFALEPLWRDAGESALGRVARYLRGPAEEADAFVSGFLRAAGERERHNLVGHGLGLLRVDRASLDAWSPYGDERVDGFVRRYVRDELARFARARAAAEPRHVVDEDWLWSRGVTPAYPARVRRRRRDGARSFVPDAIGDVPLPPPTSTTARPHVDAAPLDDALLDRIDAAAAEHDARMAAIMDRIAAYSRRPAAPPR
jgi:hypothetical protein